MLEFLSGALGGFMEGFASQTTGLIRGEIDYIKTSIRGEIDYIGTSLKTSITDGIKEGLNAVRKTMFYLLIGVGATLLGLFFLIWGLAQLLAEMFKSEGIGFSVFGLIALVIGLICFALSKPK
jgi:hypothetical protein